MTAQTPGNTGPRRRIVVLASADDLDFGKGDGLLPAVVQHAGNGAVLMLGYMNREALRATLARRRVVFFSRSRGRLWEKGETSGHVLELQEVATDCDRDALLVSAWPRGPVCHLGTASCFGDTAAGVAAERERETHALGFLGTLAEVIGERMAERPEGSYTARLFGAGAKRVAQKVGEEGLEVALAGAGGSDQEVVGEAADLLYHLLVLLKVRGLTLERVVDELRTRHEQRASPRGD
jgi:phosphoribosyl-ATP pyrophosphohydrolase/phosphoribosyl-AMP cyclohydrolase